MTIDGVNWRTPLLLVLAVAAGQGVHGIFAGGAARELDGFAEAPPLERGAPLASAGHAHPISGASLHPATLDPTLLQCIPAEACCKVCSKGKACGDTCISRQKSCHVGRGCACDAGELCR